MLHGLLNGLCRGFAVLIAASLASGAASAGRPHPLFRDDEIVRITIRAPLREIIRHSARSTDARDGMLAVEGAFPERHPIRLSSRGISRRRSDNCGFPPLRIEFTQEPARASLFRGQRRLKLVTHCRSAEAFQQYVLLEYAAYRLLNVLTPRSFRARLATVEYVEAQRERPLVSRLAFFIEDVDDVARRNGLAEARMANVPVGRLSASDAARFAVFQYMIGNLDWAMTAGPAGLECCHNSRLLSVAGGTEGGLVPVPYDFDHAGLVDTPYATPPPQVPVRNVRERRYRGYCVHNDEAEVAAVAARDARSRLERELHEVPGLNQQNRTKAMAYLSRFFDDVSSPESIARRLLSNCLR